MSFKNINSALDIANLALKKLGVGRIGGFDRFGSNSQRVAAHFYHQARRETLDGGNGWGFAVREEELSNPKKQTYKNEEVNAFRLPYDALTIKTVEGVGDYEVVGNFLFTKEDLESVKISFVSDEECVESFTPEFIGAFVLHYACIMCLKLKPNNREKYHTLEDSYKLLLDGIASKIQPN